MALDQNGGVSQPGQQGSQPAPTLNEGQIRAMRSDLATPAPAPVASPMPEPQISIPPAAADGSTTKVIFDGDEPSFSPNTTVQTGGTSVDALVGDHSQKKTLKWTIGGGIALLILGALGYFVLYPMFFTEPVAETPVVPQAPQPPARVSVFTAEQVAATSITATNPLSRESLVASIEAEGKNAQAGISELAFMTDAASPLAVGPFFSALLPEFTEVAKTNLLFVDQFTAYLYKDDAGVWPGYIATLKPELTQAELSTDLTAWFTSLEKSPIKNFFLSDPGKFEAFKEGMINEKYTNRFAPGAGGVSFSYVLLPNNRVVISTSFNGLKEAVRLMGL